MAITIGLNLAKKGPSSSTRPAPARRKLAFGDDASDADDTNKPNKQDGLQEITTFDNESPVVQDTSSVAEKPKVKPTTTQPPKLKTTLATSLQSPSISSLRSITQATADVDKSLYDYDDFLSARNAADRSRKETATSSTAHKGPNYMADLQAAAEQRKRDQDRARDKLLQRQREEEGDEFRDKEAFVTEAYKANQEETRKAEEAEKKREEEERKKRESGRGMTAFHRGVMEEQDRRHQEVLEAAKLMKELGGVVAVEGDEEREENEAEVARKLKEQGRNVEINQEGEVTDKRELLSGGLNVVAKPKPITNKASERGAAAARSQATQSNLRGNNDAKRAMRERQTKMMEMQLEQAQKRAAEEEAEEILKRERAAKSQKTSGEISSARERYLQRKREAAAQGAG